MADELLRAIGGGPMSMPVRGVDVDHILSRRCSHPLIPFVITIDRRRHRPAEIARRHSVHHQRPEGTKHGPESSERKLPPRVVLEARRCQVVESVRKYVDESRGEYYAGGEGFDHEEDILLGTESGDVFAQEWEADANGAADEDGEERGDFERPGFGFAAVLLVGGAVAVSGDDGEKRQ